MSPEERVAEKEEEGARRSAIEMGRRRAKRTGRSKKLIKRRNVGPSGVGPSASGQGEKD